MIVLEDLNVGGAQIFAVRLANALAKEHSVFLYNCNPTIFDTRLRRLVSSKVKLVHYHSQLLLATFWVVEKFFRPFRRFRSWFSKAFERHNLKRVRDFIKTQNIDVVNSHMFYADVFCNKLKNNEPNVTHIISMHGCYENKFSDSRHPVMTDGRRTLAQCDGLVIAAEKNRFAVKRLELESSLYISKIYYGFEKPVSTYGAHTGNTFTFGVVSRAIREKGWGELITAFIRLKSKFPHIRLLLVGAGDYQKKLRQQFQREESISFAGHASDTLPLTEKMDVCVLPTFFKGESLPNSIIEYLSLKKPVIATDIGEIRHMLEADGKIAGFLLQLNDHGTIDTEKLEEAMKEYLINPSLIMAHSLVAERAFQKFNIGLCAANYLRFFDKCLKRRK